MGAREPSIADIVREAQEMAEQADPVFWDWLSDQREWVSLVERFVGERLCDYGIVKE